MGSTNGLEEQVIEALKKADWGDLWSKMIRRTNKPRCPIHYQGWLATGELLYKDDPERLKKN